jgi:hypothetical protein
VFSCFHVYVSCGVWVKTRKTLSFNCKQLVKHENAKTINYGQKVCPKTVILSGILSSSVSNMIRPWEWAPPMEQARLGRCLSQCKPSNCGYTLGQIGETCESENIWSIFSLPQYFFFQFQVLFRYVINDKVYKTMLLDWHLWLNILNFGVPSSYLCWQSQILIMLFWSKI